jgi:hypothetical protein
MPKINIKHRVMPNNTSNSFIKIDDFMRFDIPVLGVGDISKEGKKIDVVCAILDLEGFTKFCNQSEPQIVIPEFLSIYLSWFMKKFRDIFVVKELKNTKEMKLYGALPFFIKFLGDGLLMLWALKHCGGQWGIGNIINNLYNVTEAYTSDFLVNKGKEFVNCPPRLRCGIARGEVIEIGGGKDYVGGCINMASRLQKLFGLSFSFQRRGMNIEAIFNQDQHKFWKLKKVDVRGIGKDELVYVDTDEFDDLDEKDKIYFIDP